MFWKEKERVENLGRMLLPTANVWPVYKLNSHRETVFCALKQASVSSLTAFISPCFLLCSEDCAAGSCPFVSGWQSWAVSWAQTEKCLPVLWSTDLRDNQQQEGWLGAEWCPGSPHSPHTGPHLSGPHGSAPSSCQFSFIWSVNVCLIWAPWQMAAFFPNQLLSMIISSNVGRAGEEPLGHNGEKDGRT